MQQEKQARPTSWHQKCSAVNTTKRLTAGLLACSYSNSCQEFFLSKVIRLLNWLRRSKLQNIEPMSTSRTYLRSARTSSRSFSQRIQRKGFPPSKHSNMTGLRNKSVGTMKAVTKLSSMMSWLAVSGRTEVSHSLRGQRRTFWSRWRQKMKLLTLKNSSQQLTRTNLALSWPLNFPQSLRRSTSTYPIRKSTKWLLKLTTTVTERSTTVNSFQLQLTCRASWPMLNFKQSSVSSTRTILVRSRTRTSNSLWRNLVKCYQMMKSMKSSSNTMSRKTVN